MVKAAGSCAAMEQTYNPTHTVITQNTIIRAMAAVIIIIFILPSIYIFADMESVKVYE
jgi:hypothetical protein